MRFSTRRLRQMGRIVPIRHARPGFYRPRRLRRGLPAVAAVLEDRTLLSAELGFALGIGGISTDEARDVTTDDAGNVYVVGLFDGTTDFDPGPGTSELTGVFEDGFAAKYSSAGDLVWARNVGGEFADSVALDASGNVYLSGILDAAPDVAQEHVLKLDNAGNLLWARSFTGLIDSFLTAVAVDDAGGVYTLGTFEGTVDFDPGPGTFELSSAGSSDVYIVKLDSAGDFVWARGVGGTSSDQGGSIAVDGTGNVYAGGRFQGTVDFDPGPGASEHTSAGGRDSFLLKLDSAGDFAWVRTVGGTGLDSLWGVEIDSAGAVYAVGQFSDTVDFDSGAGTFELSSAGGRDAYVLKLNSAGDFIWARGYGGSATDSAMEIAIDGGGNLYTTGRFAGTVDFDPGPGTFELIGDASGDTYALKLDPAGNFVWGAAAGGTALVDGEGIAVDGTGNVYATGLFSAPTDFDPGPGTFELSSAGGDDFFLWKLTQQPPDNDADGISDDIENAAPNGGDGNNDGIADSQQIHVASLPNSADAQYVTLVSPAGTLLASVEATGNPSPADAPTGVEFPVGFFDFTVQGLVPGDSSTVTMILPVPITSYWKYGPTPADPTPHWYEFTFDGTTGAVISGNMVTLHFVDGDRGDDDLAANGEIIDPGAPVLLINQPPVLDPVTDKTVDEGSLLSFVVTADDPNAGQMLTFSLDAAPAGAAVDPNSGLFTWTPNDGLLFADVTVRVTDNGSPNLSDTTSFAISVNNVAPGSGVAGPSSAVRGQPRTFTLTGSDVSPVDEGAGFDFVVDWGDGSPLEIIAATAGNGTGTPVEHVYVREGAYDVLVTATDKDGEQSLQAAHAISVHAAQLQTDPLDGTAELLAVGGTAENDVIVIRRARGFGRWGQLEVRINGHNQGTFAADGPILVFGQSGHDLITIHPLVRQSAWLHGGEDNDVLIGANGDDVLLGGPGNDILWGNGGRDLLIGGTGRDALFGGFGQNIVIAGTTDFDRDHASLALIMAEWTSTRPRTTRIENLSGLGSGPRLNGNVFLTAEGADATVHGDVDRDVVVSLFGLDWVFANQTAGVLDALLGFRSGK